MVTVEVLGPVVVRRGEQEFRVPAGRATEVLVRLALEAGTPIRAERLIEDVWGDAAVATARNTLQSKVSQLRRALGDAELLAGGADGYTLRIAPAAVDANRAEDLARSAAAARRAADAGAALASATEALALFTGDVLAGAGDGDWAVTQRTRFEEVRLALVEDQLWARIELGAGGEVVAELEALVDEHPLRERLWALLIAALYRAGRQADALAAYARVRATLVEELGLEPGPELRDLEVRVLRQDADLAAPSTGALLATPLGNLPRRAGDLVARDAELGALVAQVGAHRLVTVVGPAGVGKTRLAVEVARNIQVPGGTWLVRLDAVDHTSESGADVGRVVAETLHLPEARVLVERLSGAPTLLVLDNCEHLVDQVAALVDELLDAAPTLRVLATSQVPLAVPGEVVEVLDPLPLSASVALFADRAAAARSGFHADAETLAAVEAVCRSLDGLPLAIELAAARVRSLSVVEIGRRLEERFMLLRDPAARGPERRTALAAAISWSYDLLTAEDQRGLWAVSCGAGGAPLGAVDEVMAALDLPADQRIDVIDRLVDRSLVMVEERPGGAVRYRTLDSIRAYATDRLAASGLGDVADRAHAEWFAGLADRCDAEARRAGQLRGMTIARDERANVDAALAWAAAHDGELGLRLANGMAWTWVVLGDGAAGAQRLRDAVAHAPMAPAADRARAHLVAGWLEASAGDVARAERDLDMAATTIDALGGGAVADALRADVHRHRAFLRIQQGRPDEVLAEAAASLDHDRAADRAWEVASGLLLSAFGSIMLGDPAAAGASADEAVDLLTPLGDSWGLLHASAMSAAVAELDGRTDVAADALARAADEAERLGFLGQAALHRTSLGRVQRSAGRPELAVTTLQEALDAAARAGDLRIAATGWVEMARALDDTGQRDGAIERVRMAADWYRDAAGDGELLARCLLALWTGDELGLEAVRTEAERAGDAEVLQLLGPP